MDACETCLIGKAKQKGVVRVSGHQVSEKIGQRIFIDISSVKNPEFLELEVAIRSYWVDEKTQLSYWIPLNKKLGWLNPCANYLADGNLREKC